MQEEDSSQIIVQVRREQTIKAESLTNCEKAGTPAEGLSGGSESTILKSIKTEFYAFKPPQRDFTTVM